MNGFTSLEIEASSDYLRTKSGETVTFHILSEQPKKENAHWVGPDGGKKEKKACIGKNCEFCMDGNIAKQRWTCDVLDRKDGKAKKFEFGAMIAGQIKNIAELLAENQQTVHDVDIRIKTTGSGLETEYSVLYVPKTGSVPQEMLDKFRIPF